VISSSSTVEGEGVALYSWIYLQNITFKHRTKLPVTLEGSVPDFETVKVLG